MNTKRWLFWVLLLVSAFTVPAYALSPHALAVGVRQHQSRTDMPDLPYDDGDLSYLLGYEYFSGNIFWQIGAGYAPEVNGDDAANYVVTPELNLIAEDKCVRIGIGVLDSYVDRGGGTNTFALVDGVQTMQEPQGSDWTDVYWHVLLGVTIPLGHFSIDLYTYYPFEELDDFNTLGFGDLEYGAWLGYRF